MSVGTYKIRNSVMVIIISLIIMVSPSCSCSGCSQEQIDMESCPGYYKDFAGSGLPHFPNLRCMKLKLLLSTNFLHEL